MNFRTLLAFSILGAGIVATGCRSESYDYCYGVNETNMPPRVVIVENSRSAERYELRGNDSRLREHNRIYGDPFLIAFSQELTFNYPSCMNIDGMDSHQQLDIGDVRREMIGPSVGKTCGSLAFDAESSDGTMALTGIECLSCGNVFYHMTAENLRPPPILQGEDSSWSLISISPTYSGRAMPFSNAPLNETDLYAQETEDDSPPLVIARVWAFENTPEMAEAKAYLGIESDEPIIRCGDLYYGYYAR